MSSLLCSSSPHPISITGLVCGLRELKCIWGGPLSPGQSGTEERGLKHYWFTSWPDQKTPDRAPPLLHLVQEVEEAAQQEGPHCAPIIVHCRWVLPATSQGRPAPAAVLPLTLPIPSALSAGIGRTGCFIATSICCQQLRQEGVVDILKTTCQLRQDRSAHRWGREHREPQEQKGEADLCVG